MNRRLCILAVCCSSSVTLTAAEDAAFFESRIRPVLVAHCYECHSAAGKIEGQLQLDHRDGLRKGGESGPAVAPNEPDKSLLLQAMRHESLKMPPAGKLSETVLADFTKWIRDGAIDPRDAPPSPSEAAAEAWQAKLAERRQWWSLQPPRDSRPPEVEERGLNDPADAFLAYALHDAGLTFAPAADADTLGRRLAFVLTGLPPTPVEVAEFHHAFAADPESAVRQRIDALLASAHFGERFARHWMDVVRYTDTFGYEWDNPAKGSWEFRDYLARAFNADIGFDVLLREQIAGDLLSPSRIDAANGINESLIGPMFYHMGEHRHGASLEFNGVHQEMVDNKIDAFSKAFLGMTVACARCHDHKLDAVSQADYYALAGVFMTPRWTPRDVTLPQRDAAALTELKRLRADIQHNLAHAWKSHASTTLSATALRDWARAHHAEFKDAKIEDIAFPIAQLVKSADSSSDADLVTRWQQLAKEWRAQRESRQTANAAQFTTVIDFSEPGFPDGWVIDGRGLEDGYVTDGTVLVALQGEGVIESVLPRGYHTQALSSKQAGVIHLPRPESFPKKIISLKMAGGDWAGRIEIPQNAFQSETIAFFAPGAPATWQAVTARGLANGVTRVVTEFATASMHPNFPPRTGLARAGTLALPDTDDGMNKRSWFSLTAIVAHDTPGVPADTLDAFSSLYHGAAPTAAEHVWQRLSDWLAGSVTRWAASQASSEDVRVMNWLVSQKLLPNRMESLPNVGPLVEAYRRVESRIGQARTVMSMDERQIEPVNYRLNIRGNVDTEGPAVPRDFLEVFRGQHQVAIADGSGRRELADYLASGRHPQTARVYVNRVWQWVFGTGLVATPNDFGKLGDRPSHPELLDWLTHRFIEEGWSTKRLVRRLLLTRAFQQSGEVTTIAADRDPGDRLLHHYPTRRLEAEAIRDALLAVSARLNDELAGPPINPPRVAEDKTKRLFAGPWDTRGRRSLYLTMSIMEPPKFLAGFNLPDLKLPTGRRDVTNVPGQALILLNDPFVSRLAEHWAEIVIQDGHIGAADRVAAMFVTALGRKPTIEERERWTAAVASFAKPGTDPMNDVTAWTQVALAVFNTKEFLYYR
ncbi:MAG TPA: PSD1 and planctomycete cytochrome C domain-containing protein [Planctomycetaceae bacterium]|nr:PSD1 and planctomycete cytochrome C domain-containing protein [Planctomycetaceae bacterium]